MNSALRFVLCTLFVICMVSFVGCAKKTEPTTPSTPAAAEPTTAAPAAPVAPAAKTPEIPAPAVPAQPVVSKLTGDALAAVPMEQVKAEAGKLNVEQLKAKATDYKDAITAKKAEIVANTAEFKEIPVTELLGDDAKTLKANIDKMTKTASDLTERFQVYNNKLKELGGTSLSLTQ